MTNFDDYKNENKTKHNLKWPYIPDNPYRVLVIGGWVSFNNAFIEFNKQPVRYW